MGICYRCKEPTFLKEYKETIDGEERIVCGKCRNPVCAICGKDKRNDGVTRWSFEKDPQSGEFIEVGGCCTFIMGKMDMFKLYSEKYNYLKKNDPKTLEAMDREANKQKVAQRQYLNSPAVADKLIDRWARSQKKQPK